MTTANLYLVSATSGTVSTPNNALGNTPTTWTTDVNTNTSWTERWRLDTVAGSSATGTQTITINVRKGSNTGNPTVNSVTLYQGASNLGTISSGSTTVTSTTGQDIVCTFDGSILTTLDNVDIEVVTTGVGGTSGARNCVAMSMATWAVSYTVAATNATIAASDAPDVAAAVGATWMTAQVAFTDGHDVATSITAEVWTTAQIDATDAPDVAAATGTSILLYYTVYLDGTAPTGPEIVSGLSWADAAAVGNAGANDADGTQSFPEVIGLADGDYRCAFVLTDGTNYSNVAVSDVVTVGTTTTEATIAATDGADIGAATGAVWVTAQLAATDGQDVTASQTVVTTGGTIASTDASDTTTATVATWTTAQVSTTDAADTAGVASATYATGQIAATDAPDIAAVGVMVTVEGSIAATDSPDTVAAAGNSWRTGSVDATDAADIAAVATSVTTGASVAATDALDTAAAAAENWTAADIATTDAPDTAQVATIIGDVTLCAISAADAPDQTSVLTSVTTGAGIDATDAGDSTESVAETWMTGQVAAVDAADIAALATSGTTQPEPVVVEQPPGGGGKKRKRKQVAAPSVPRQPSAREVAIEAIAERRTRDVHRQTGLVPPSPTLPEPVQRIAREIMRAPLPALTQEAVEQRIPQGKQAWKWREAIERRAARARKPDEGAAAMRELMDNTAALQEQLAAQQRRELDLVFVMAVMATEEVD